MPKPMPRPKPKPKPRPKPYALAVATIALLLQACSSPALNPPPQLSPIGDMAFYARRLVQAVDTLQNVAIDGEAAGVIPKDDARRIVQTTVAIAQANESLARALKAGTEGETGRKRAIAVIRSALNDLPQHLSPHAADVVRPYLTTIATFLTVFE